MNERLLQFIWQFQYFSKKDLYTTGGEVLRIEKPGSLNRNQGPDFSEAIVSIGTTRWAGNVELHMLSSDWYKHHHAGDLRYSNIILHVVWADDSRVNDALGHPLPTLVLQPHVPKLMLTKYAAMMANGADLPCRSFLPAMDELHWLAWKERLVAERLERKAVSILNRLRQCNHHWEECCWQLLAGNFGIKINSQLFEQVAQSLPVTLLARHKHQFQQTEALLFGQANLLSGKYSDAYARLLQREYRFLKKKYRLPLIQQQPAFLRMRPATFPTVRLAQLAMLLHQNPFLFSMIRDAGNAEKLQQAFMVTANDYWHHHYRFDEDTLFNPKHLGRQMAENLMINTAIPVLFAYGMYCKEDSCRERAIQWLLELPAEKNRITTQWGETGITHQNALDSQALIELTNQYCYQKRCLDCSVGNRILKKYVS